MSSANRLVLIVDDDETDRERVVRWLGHSFPVVQAATARVGLEMVDSLKPACILLDYRLNDADGLSVLSDFHWGGSQVILMTGEGDQTVAAESIKRGAFDYLVKDQVTQQTLQTCVDKAVRMAATAHRLSRTEKELGDLLHAAKSELSPELSAALGSCSQALSATPKQQVEHIEAAHNSLASVVSYFDRLLEYAGCDAKSPWTRVDLQEALSVAARRAELPRAVRTRFESLPIIRGDSRTLELMLYSLLRYSLEAGGEAMDRISVQAEQQNGQWLVTMISNGAGAAIALEDVRLPSLYDQSGWEVALARKVVRQHGGSLTVESTPGAGLEIQLRIPDR